MAFVVSDTTPIHYLILVGKVAILERLYSNIIIPPAVLSELSHASAPAAISAWALRPPAWISVQAPTAIPSELNGLGLGERQAIVLAGEIGAEWVLLDDKVARRVATRLSLNAKGTLGIVADAARANLLDFVDTIEALQRTSMHIDQKTVDQIIRDYRRTHTGGTN